MPVLVFLPIFVAIGFLIANRRRAPQPALIASERRTKSYQLSIAATGAVAIAVTALPIIHH